MHINRFSLHLGLAALLLLPLAAGAATYSEFGDAGPMPVNAGITVGNGVLTQIQGTFLSATDIDMYCFRIYDRANFLADISCLALSDPDLWLFDAAGNGISLYDGCAGGLVRLTGAFVPSNGLYYLAIAGSEQDAVNNLNLPIWNSPTVSAERAPDGPGAPGPIAGWLGTPLSVPPNYTISLVGATFCDSPVPALPESWGGIKARYDSTGE